VARAGAVDRWSALPEKLGAGVVFEGLRARNSFPTDHPAYRGTLAFDAPGGPSSSPDNDAGAAAGRAVLRGSLVRAGSPIPAGCKVLQIEAGARRWPTTSRSMPACWPIWALAWRRWTRRCPRSPRGQAQRGAEGQKDADDAAQKARVEKAWSRSPTSMARCMAEIKAGAPKDVVVVDETITANLDLFKTFTFRARATTTAAAAAASARAWPARSASRWPSTERPILCLSGDGSSMYSIQALWTAAHHDLPIVFVILANREYRC
jgi:benzoylformate decarboxylase